MKSSLRTRDERGFSLAELLVASTIFLLVAGAAFSLLGSSAQRFKTDSQVLTSFQEARLGIDQITRDVADAGFPPRNRFLATAAPPTNLYVAGPFAWTPNYPNPCTVGGTCTIPNGFDLIVETDVDPLNNNGVEWVRYQLLAGDTTMTRAVVSKPAGGTTPDVTASGAGVLLPYLQNVMNNGTGAQIAAIRAAYPAMFPGGNPVPVFTYTCDVVGGSPAPCTAANTAADIRDVDVTLIVQSISRDVKTNALRLVQLHGLGHRNNPNK
jgi:prepilin-type N-terminal cleavage/methylation domain-containing protein